jgi:DNA-binding NtrC family response regulator
MGDRDRILVVEDDPLVSEVIAAALDLYPVTLVESAARALECLRAGGIGLILLDCTLPGGVDEALLPEAAKAGAKVVLMSGDPGRMEKLADQPLPFILKPFTLGGLVETVERIFGPPPAA